MIGYQKKKARRYSFWVFMCLSDYHLLLEGSQDEIKITCFYLILEDSQLVLTNTILEGCDALTDLNVAHQAECGSIKYLLEFFVYNG